MTPEPAPNILPERIRLAAARVQRFRENLALAIQHLETLLAQVHEVSSS